MHVDDAVSESAFAERGQSEKPHPINFFPIFAGHRRREHKEADIHHHPQPRMISQWHIDNTLAAIAILSSRLKMREEEQTTSVVFTGLCRIFSNMLVMHRIKLGGRYHLILPALQGLLRCLFIPYSNNHNHNAANSTVANNAQSSPPAATSTPVGAADAAAYARLLTTICDPTVSAVTRRHRSSKNGRYGLSLNDETKKARGIAGQHLQYLAMEYCKYQLREYLRPEFKSALTPGLYAVLDVLTPEVMRTMNAAMDSSSRSIFKALYDDYRRQGRWQGT